MKTALTQARRSALTLLAFAVVASAILASTYWLTRDTVLANEHAAKLALLQQVLPSDYDNQPLSDTVALSPVEAKRLGHDQPAVIHLARRQGQVVAYAFETIAPNGYSGKIRLLLGVDAQGQLLGVRVVSHKETPGLGDYIDLAKSDWAQQFTGQSWQGPAAAVGYWKVKKDGGAFDYMTGATISARAVTSCVGRAVAWLDEWKQKANQ